MLDGVGGGEGVVVEHAASMAIEQGKRMRAPRCKVRARASTRERVARSQLSAIDDENS